MKSMLPSGTWQLSTSIPVDHRMWGWTRLPLPVKVQLSRTLGPGSRLPVHTKYMLPPAIRHRSSRFWLPSMLKSVGLEAPRLANVCWTTTSCIVMRWPARVVLFIVSSQKTSRTQQSSPPIRMAEYGAWP